MTNFKVALMIGGMTFGVAAGAQAAQMSDVEYVHAVRCEALASSPALGKGDARALQALIRQQERGRGDIAEEVAQQAHDNAVRQARVAGAYEKTSLIAERDGFCKSLTSGDAVASTR